MARAHRHGVDLTKLKRLLQAKAAAMALAPFAETAPERQPDAQT